MHEDIEALSRRSTVAAKFTFGENYLQMEKTANESIIIIIL